MHKKKGLHDGELAFPEELALQLADAMPFQPHMPCYHGMNDSSIILDIKPADVHRVSKETQWWVV